MTGEHIVIVALVLLNVVQFAALCLVVVKVAPMLPPSVVTELLTQVIKTGFALAEESLARAGAVAEKTPTPLDNLGVDIAKRVVAELKSGAVRTPLEEK